VVSAPMEINNSASVTPGKEKTAPDS
jgi:hypothetical protein